MEASFPGTPPGIGELRHAVGELARRHGLDEATQADVRLAVSEAATNAVVHAYRDHPGELRVRAELRDGELLVVIADSGGGVRPRRDSPGMGLGLPLMASVAGRFEVVSGDDGTQVHLAFPCSRRAVLH